MLIISCRTRAVPVRLISVIVSTAGSSVHSYFHFSYQTNNGVVSGIQWVPAEATSVLPNGAQPANAVCDSTITLCPAISDQLQFDRLGFRIVLESKRG